MNKVAILTQMPEVKGLVVGDRAGSLSESHNESDAESVAAVMGFLSNAVTQSGETLGFGTAQKLTIGGPSRACVMYMLDEAVVTIFVDPNKPIGSIEKKIEQALQI